MKRRPVAGRPVRALVAAVAVLGAIVATAGCSGGKALTASTGATTSTVERVAAAERGGPLTVSGTTLDGAALSTAAYRGQVVVLNYWGSWCQPCIKETPDLKAAWAELEPEGVKFVGLDAQEGPQTGAAYQKANGVTYPSLQWDGGRFLLQLKGKAPAPPTTIVLDQQGRLAARVLAPVGRATLVGLVDDVLNGAGG